MKIGIIKRIDDLGRIVIPQEIRKMLSIKSGDPLEISVDGNKIILELYSPTYDHNADEVVKDLQYAAEWFSEHGRNTNTSIIRICESAIEVIHRQQARIATLDKDSKCVITKL